MRQIVIPSHYPSVICAVLGMNLQMWINGFQIGFIRRKIFNKQFMEKYFQDVHKRELGEDIEPGGYPDAGNGNYSSKLSYKDWYDFNIYQRIHLNYVEGISFASAAVLAAGLYAPDFALGLGITYIFGRMLYSIGYKRKGGAMNIMRMMGVFLSSLSVLSGIVCFLGKAFELF